MLESEILDQLRKKIAIPRGSAVKRGIGDDCAIYRPGGASEDLLFTTDLLLEDVHFRRSTHRAEDVGWKALARGLSDIAAMGGDPRFSLLSLAVPKWADGRWIDGFWRGLLALSEKTGAVLAGGDLARSETFACDIVVCGAAPKGQALMRSGARAGDEIYVSGSLGGSSLGLRSGKGKAWKKHVRPEPRLALGKFARDKLHATAAMDLSDGLSIDLQRMCVTSRVSASIEAPPRFPGASLDDSLHGGEDYELLFTVRRGTHVPAEFKDLALTHIGTMTKAGKNRVSLYGKPLAPLGYDHFRNA